jgi:hypothetical protein
MHVIVVKRDDAVIMRLELSAEPGGNVSLKLDPTTVRGSAGSEANETGGLDVHAGPGETTH